MVASTISEKRWNIIAVIVVIFLIIIIFAFSGGLNALLGRESESSVLVYELNQSIVPRGIIHSLTEEDFIAFPQLASIIRDKNNGFFRLYNKYPVYYEGNTPLYSVPLTMEEKYAFQGRFWSNDSGLYTGPDSLYRFFEYKGKYYKYTYPVIH